MNNERFEELLYKFQFKLLSTEEKEEFELILKSSEEARKMFHDWNVVNQAFDVLSTYKEQSVIPVGEAKHSAQKHSLIYHLIKIAAVLAIPLLAISIILFVNKQNNVLTSYNEVSCVKGSVVSINLSDGSVVHLYSGSTLRYPTQFTGDIRSVNLVGEATFEVQSNKEKPFYVETIDNSKIKAYGTKFNVCGYERDSLTSVYLEHGAVDFESPNLENPIVIKPQTRIDYMRTTNKYRISEESPDKYLARENGVLLFLKAPLQEITTTLSRVYDIDIEIKDDALKNVPFTASIKDESIYQIMNMLKKSSPDLKWKKEETTNKIVITKN
jgi:ferric-dicitrate binding protein FerR (iron transport regulator)